MVALGGLAQFLAGAGGAQVIDQRGVAVAGVPAQLLLRARPVALGQGDQAVLGEAAGPGRAAALAPLRSGSTTSAK